MNKYATQSRIVENRMCWRKKQFANASEAMEGVAYGRPYRCPVCCSWHRTSKPEHQPQTKCVLAARTPVARRP